MCMVTASGPWTLDSLVSKTDICNGSKVLINRNMKYLQASTEQEQEHASEQCEHPVQ